MGAPKIVYFLAYAYSFILYGSIITGMGPIIPYFALATNKPETSFSYIFFVRALGYLLGGSLIKILTQKYSTHAILMTIELIGGLALIGSSLSLNPINLAVCMFISAACCCMINVVSNMCVLKLFSGDNQDYWIQLLHLVFGAGGLVGPFIIIKFHEHSFFILGLMFISSIPLFYFLKAPESRDSVRKS
jgi:fucose permease